MGCSSAARDRVQRLCAAARRIQDPSDPLGREARERLPAITGLSLENVELALSRCLEASPSEDELEQLTRGVAAAPRAHVLLSANVFVAAHRAIALALAAAPRVFVRSSRREGVMAELLGRADPGLFERVGELLPNPGDHVWAYGADETLKAFQAQLPPGVVLHAHGSGFGVAVVQHGHDSTLDWAERLSEDISLFDQRGCLSPRVVLYQGPREGVESCASALSRALERTEARIPRGRLHATESQMARRVSDTLMMTGRVIPAGKGWVGVDAAGLGTFIPPPGRHVVVSCCSAVEQWLHPHRQHLTAIGFSGDPSLRDALSDAVTGARISRLGEMQRPPLDGPVDRRAHSVRMT